MAVTVCPYCGYDRSLSVIGKGAAKGALSGLAFLINPILGALVVSGLAVNAVKNLDKTQVVCPNEECGRIYEI